VSRLTANGGAILTTLMGSGHVATDKMENRATSSWVFSISGLRRLSHGAGRKVLDEMTLGNTDRSSDTARQDRDERALMLSHSTRLTS
jgi:hypothetical protein